MGRSSLKDDGSMQQQQQQRQRPFNQTKDGAISSDSGLYESIDANFYEGQSFFDNHSAFLPPRPILLRRRQSSPSSDPAASADSKLAYKSLGHESQPSKAASHFHSTAHVVA